MITINRSIYFYLLSLIATTVSCMTQEGALSAMYEKSAAIEYLFTYHTGLVLNNPELKRFQDQYFKEECYHPDKKKEGFKKRLEAFFSQSKNNSHNPSQKLPFLLHETVLHACHPDTLKKLHQGGYDLNKVDPAGYTPLLLACKFKNEKAVEFLLSNIHEIKPSLAVADRRFFNYLPIHYICQDAKNSRLLPRLLFAAQENGTLPALLAATNSLGNTPLETALGSNPASLEMAKSLIAHGAPINKFSVMGRTPLMMSISTCEELVPLLLEKGANPNQTIQSEGKIKVADAGTPALHLACQYDKPRAVKALLEKGAQPNKTQASEFSQHNTALHVAASHSSVGCIEELIKSKITNVNAVNNAGNTPLHEACIRQNLSIHIIQKLVNAGAKTGAQNKMGLNPLTLLITRNQYSKEVNEIVSYLIANKASKQSQAIHDIALSPTIDKDMLSFLLQNGWSINDIDSRANTILHKLIIRKHQHALVFAEVPDRAKIYISKIDETIGFLISKGAKPRFENDGNKNPMALNDILQQESSRDTIIPRPKKKSKNFLLALLGNADDEFEEDDYTDYQHDQAIISQTRKGKKTYLRLDNFSPFMMQPNTGPVVLYASQDAKRANENDAHHNFSLIVDHYLGAGIYMDSDNQDDPDLSNMCKLLELKPLERGDFAVLVIGKLLNNCKDEKLVHKVLQERGTRGAFIYIFKKENKMCFHRKFNPFTGTPAQVSDCLDMLKKNQNVECAYNHKKTPSLVLNT